MIRIFIENRELVLDKGVQVAITKQFEDLTNPTTIINDWSKTVSIPFNSTNNAIFGQAYCPDRLIAKGGSAPIGIYFDPYKKLDMRVQWGDNVLMTGYAKMNDIKQSNGVGTYNLTLFGQLGKVLQELNKITFDKSYPLEEYIIPGEVFVDEYINKELVYNTWTSAGQWQQTAQHKYIIPGPGAEPVANPGYRVTDIIGFAPNNSFSEEFDYKCFQSGGQKSEKFEDVLGTGFTQDTGIEGSVVLPDGLMPREIGEYRSYYQLPWIYFNKLFQIFQEKAESLTGYNFVLDPDWFSAGNPYWYRLVYMLKPFDVKMGDLYNNQYSDFSTRYYDNRGVNIGEWSGGGPFNREYTYQLNPRTADFEQLDGIHEMSDYSNKFVFGDNGLINFHFQVNTYLLVITQDVHIKDDNGLIFTVTATGSNGTTKDQKFLIRHKGSTFTVEGIDTIVECGTSDQGGNFRYGINIETMNAYFSLSQAEMGSAVTFSTSAKWAVNSYPISSPSGSQVQGTVVLYYGYSTQSGEHVGIPSHLKVTVPHNKWFHSNGHFILNDLWNNDYGVFHEILNYCKMYRIGIEVDDIGKKIIFKPIRKYFENYTVSDWNTTVNKTKDFSITPITFENKYVLFNYVDLDTKLNEEYRERYGVNYGEYRIVTDYNFNDETTELFDEVTPSMTNTDNVLSWTNLYDYHNIIYSFPAEIYVYNKDNDRKQVDIFGAYFFHNGLAEFSTEEELHMRSVVLSDDTAFQLLNNKYIYTQNADETLSVTTYPKLDIVRGKNLCVFNVPMENYTYNNNYAGKNSIFENFWHTYLDERYNVQNKKITCHANLKPSYYQMFEWRKFAKIDNQICMVNKISDYDVTSFDPTKVELITIQNPAAYSASTQFTTDSISASTTSMLNIPSGEYKYMTVTASAPWKVSGTSWNTKFDVIPSSGDSGTTKVYIGALDSSSSQDLRFEIAEEDAIYVDVHCSNTSSNMAPISMGSKQINATKNQYYYPTLTSSVPWEIRTVDQSEGAIGKPGVSPTGGTGTNIITVHTPMVIFSGRYDFYFDSTTTNDATRMRVVAS